VSTTRLVVAACCMAAVGGYLRLGASGDVLLPAAQLTTLPGQIGEWRSVQDLRLDPPTEKSLQADSYILRTYTRGALPVTLFVAYYGSQRSGHTIHSPLNCLPGTGWEWTDRRRETVLAEPGREIEVNRNLATRNRQQILVYYWYQSRGRAVASDYRNKVLLMRDALTMRRSDGALVRVTVPVDRDDQRSMADATTFIQDVFRPLTRLLPE
jgi:EpsI family protein